MKKNRNLLALILVLGLIITLQGCQEEEELPILNLKDAKVLASEVPYHFNWETADWMPTPPGQKRIPSPWIGRGSLTSVHGIDVINDRKASDGWELLYSTFTREDGGELVDPYFILYNKYRGLMRIFVFTTTESFVASSYLQDGISIVSNHETSLLNFLGTDLIDVASNSLKYSQMQPMPSDGSLPLGGRKWYMLQYELAYDPDLGKIPYQEIQLSWFMNYHNIERISLGGNIVGTLNGAAGSNNEILSKLGDVGKTAGTMVLAGIGKNFFTKQTIDENTGENKLGLPNKVFKAAAEGAGKAISNAQSGLPKVIMNFLGAVIGGSSGGATASFNMNADVNLEGTAVSSGSFSSSPTSMWIPGTNISPNAIGFLPLYNKKLGVFNLTSKPTIIIGGECRVENYGSSTLPWHANSNFSFPKVDFSNLLVFNDDVLNIADIGVLRQEVVVLKKEASVSINSLGGEREVIGNYGEVFINPQIITESFEFRSHFFGNFKVGVRFSIKVTPKNGAPSSIITKTFLINADLSNVNLKFG